MKLCLLTLVMFGPLFGEVSRLGLFIGNDVGLSNEKPLKYSSKDAREMANIFLNNGGFEKDRVYVLENQNKNVIVNTLKEMRGRIKEIKRNGKKVVSLVYYSGHGSSDALHLNEDKLLLSEFSNSFEKLESDLKVLIVDACESGSLLRTKGGKVIQEYNIQKIDSLDLKGTALISSSSAGELSQESEDYQGGVFTHHLINGLNGVADYNGDQEISLWEAYNYANTSTRRENVYGKVSQQNPNFDLDLVGRSNVVLTTLHKNSSQILFKSFKNEEVKIHDGTNMNLRAKLILSGRDSIQYRLPSQDYLLTYEDGNKFKVAKVALKSGKIKILHPGDFQIFSKSEVYRKGGKIITLNPHSMKIGLDWTKVGSINRHLIYTAGYQYRKAGFQHVLSLGYGMTTLKNPGLEILTSRVGKFSYDIAKPIHRMSFGRLLLGLSMGYYQIWQKLEDIRDWTGKSENKNFNSNVYELDLFPKYEHFLFGMVIGIGGNLGYQLYQKSEDNLNFGFRMEPNVTLGYRF